MPAPRPPFVLALLLALLVGCGSGPTASAQPTATPRLQVAVPSPAQVGSGQASPAPSPAAAASPRVAAAPRPQLAGGSPAINLELVTNQLNQPVYATHAGDGSGRIFVVEKKGRIVIVRGGGPPTVFLHVAPLVGSCGREPGHCSVAFHPRLAA